MDAAIRERVRRRANHRCEYCRLSQKLAPFPAFHIEHIRPKKHGGTDVETNLCLACNHCNLHKGTNLSGIDPETREAVRLFHPRTDEWDDHFAMRAGMITGLTPVGRATSGF